MQISFDLISDLHIETWDTPLDMDGQQTSVFCVVAGDISRDRDIVIETLAHLGQCYKMVLYIDGNEEHKNSIEDIHQSYESLIREIEDIENVMYLQDNLVIIEGVGFIGTNGWWDFEFDHPEDYNYSKQWYMEKYHMDYETANSIEDISTEDAAYLYKSVSKLQTLPEVKQLVVVSHTVPDVGLLEHDPDLAGTHKLNCMGSSRILTALGADTEEKISTWCFGHYHQPIDEFRHSIRFVNNCRGRGDTPYSKSVYYPKKIVLDL